VNIFGFSNIKSGSSLFPVGKGELRKIAPRGNSGEDACGEIPDLGVEADGSV
jgi:hypothetical protein